MVHTLCTLSHLFNINTNNFNQVRKIKDEYLSRKGIMNKIIVCKLKVFQANKTENYYTNFLFLLSTLFYELYRK